MMLVASGFQMAELGMIITSFIHGSSLSVVYSAVVLDIQSAFLPISEKISSGRRI